MTEQIAQWFSALPKEWVVFLIATLPIIELRGAIPWALSGAMGGSLGWPTAFLLSFAGNLFPILPVLAWLGPLSDRWMERSPLANRFFTWLFARTRRRGDVVARYGPLGLAVFVAIPLPGTGAWTGAILAFLFGIPIRTAFLWIALGVLGAGAIVTLASLGILQLFGL